MLAAAWTPNERYLERSRLRRFAEANGCRDFDALLAWSVEDLDGFWRAVDRDLALVWRMPYHRGLDTAARVAPSKMGDGRRLHSRRHGLPDQTLRSPVPLGSV